MAAITESQCYRLKLLLVLETAGQEVLTYTLLCGMKYKDLPYTLEGYLRNLPDHSTANYTSVRSQDKRFNHTDRHQITNDPSCSSFDISLLHKAIKLACEDVAGISDSKWTLSAPQPWELEFYVTKIKDFRNDIVHECTQQLNQQAFLDKVAELSHLFVTTLEAAKNRYGRDEAEYLAKKEAVLDAVKDIREANLGEQEIIQSSVRKMLPLLKTETDGELRMRLDNAQYIHPLTFLSNTQNQRVDVNQIFCDIILINKMMTSHGEPYEVPYLEMLQLCEGGGPHFLMVEGEAGSGKTTLATFLLAQWLRPQCDRRVKGLQHYDQVLRVVCRNRSKSSLRDFVEALLPESYVRFGHLLLPLLKQCRVLVLVDGLDERNDMSLQLVEDIICEAATTTFTIVCTSRPHSVLDMKSRAQWAGFQLSHVKMMGINPSMRTELVGRHYAWLSGEANRTLDTTTLKRFMKQIDNKDLLRLPLNLLFIATFFFYQPDRVSTNFTQSKLYQFIHDWCQQKLLERLGTPSQAGRSRVFRQEHITKALKVMYEVALKGLLQSRMNLSGEDLKDVRDACSREGLNPEEVLPAFYCLRREESFGVTTESYFLPHKGLQEFYAAKHVAGQLTDYTGGAIKRVVQSCIPGQVPCYDNLRNMLRHLLGLLTRQADTKPLVLEEAVDLLHQAGFKTTSEWVSLLADTGAPSPALQRVVQILGSSSEVKITYVTDDTVAIALLMLPHLPRRTVWVHLTREPASVDDLVLGLAGHDVHYLDLGQHCWRPQQHADPANLLPPDPRTNQGSANMASSTASPLNHLMLLHIIETVGRKVLLYILLCGMKYKEPSQTLQDYLTSLPQDSTAEYSSRRKDIRRLFTRGEMEPIISDPSFTTFHITLLYKAITVACEYYNSNRSTDPSQSCNLEYCVRKIKDIRNGIVHESHRHIDQQAFLNRVAEMSELFVTTLEATRDRYGRDNAEYLAKKDEVLNTVEDILEQNFSESILQVIMNCHSSL